MHRLPFPENSMSLSLKLFTGHQPTENVSDNNNDNSRQFTIVWAHFDFHQMGLKL